VDPLALADDRSDHGIHARAIASTGEDADAHRWEHTAGPDGVLSIPLVGWDIGRPVPWRRLAKEWLIYAAIMTVVFALFFRGNGLVPILAGLLVSGPLYLAIGYALAKFGYQRKSLGELRAARPATSAGSGATSATATDRARPAPTRRTSTGPNRPTKRRH
jgi:hypothetical protein